MTARPALYLLLVVVAAAAAVLSFSALKDLALLCGFDSRLAPLLPVVVDAGAAAGSLVWLGGHGDIRAQRFACRLALVLLASSVAANAVSHGLEAYRLRPAWWVVVVVSAVSPAVLGAVVHLAVLVGRAPVGDSPAAVSDRVNANVPPTVPPVSRDDQQEPDSAGQDVPPVVPADVPSLDDDEHRVMELIAAGAGRRKLSRELKIPEHQARALLAARRNGTAP